MEAVVAPVLHKYEVAPAGAESVVLVPQTVVVAGNEKFNESTVTVIASVHATPFTVVVHVYVVVAVGETVIDGVVAFPGDQAYVV
jgi:hypothetical protein